MAKFKDLKQKSLTIEQKKAFLHFINKDKIFKESAKERFIKDLLKVKIKRRLKK